MRIAVLPLETTLALHVVTAVRLRDSFDKGASTALYLAGVGILLVTIGAVSVVEKGRCRASITPRRAPA